MIGEEEIKFAKWNVIYMNVCRRIFAQSGQHVEQLFIVKLHFILVESNK